MNMNYPKSEISLEEAKNYRAYYDESSKAIITNSFRREIDINSYRFE
jgi:hypothetical protein